MRVWSNWVMFWYVFWLGQFLQIALADKVFFVLFVFICSIKWSPLFSLTQGMTLYFVCFACFSPLGDVSGVFCCTVWFFGAVAVMIVEGAFLLGVSCLFSVAGVDGSQC